MFWRFMILLTLVVAVVLGVSVIDITNKEVTADNGETSYTALPPKPENTPGPHFAFQQQQLAQSSGLARLDVPQPSKPLPPGRTFRNMTMPTPLTTRRQQVDIIKDVLLDAKRANPNLNATNVKAIVEDGDIVKILVECNCNPRPVMIGGKVPETPVKYFTFTVDRRHNGHLVSAGPETEETRTMIARGVRGR